MRHVLRFNRIIKALVLTGDLIILNTLFVVLFNGIAERYFSTQFMDSLPQILVLLNLCYLLCNVRSGVILHQRVVRPDKIVWRVLQNMFYFSVLFITLLTFSKLGYLSIRFFAGYAVLSTATLIAYRLSARYFIKLYRKEGGNSRSVVLVNCSSIHYIYKELTGDSTSGFKVQGYFDDLCKGIFPQEVPFLGNSQDLLPYLQQNKIEQIYYGFPSANNELVSEIISYCENNCIRFFCVPDFKSHFNRRVNLDFIGNAPILSIYREPLLQTEKRVLKRAFDIVFSLLFLCTLFPIIYIAVAIAIKISSPGPIFFKQKRSGQDGEEFWCYKFRSMRVNTLSDTLQATKDDPRKTKLGGFLRRSNIDELPQFINVLRGEMSVVGPRPHMLKHTEEYSKSVSAYMVRHFIKPGVTGWAQINGFRGETKELWQMQGRVERDIWYMEHWSFMLDLYIIYKTVKNIVQGEKDAY